MQDVYSSALFKDIRSCCFFAQSITRVSQIKFVCSVDFLRRAWENQTTRRKTLRTNNKQVYSTHSHL